MARALVKNASNPNPRNLIINGALDFWQRNTSFSLVNSTAYTADRWNCFVNSGTSTGSTLTRSTDVPSTDYLYSAKVTRIAADTNTGGFILVQPIEIANTRNLKSKQLTVSFWAKKGANFSPVSSALQIVLHSGTGSTDPTPAGALTGQADVILANTTLTSSWQRFSVTGTTGNSVTQLRLQIRANHTGTAGADDSFYITGIMLTEGPSAPVNFYRAGSTIDHELAICQRYCIVYGNNTSVGDSRFGLGQALTTASALIQVYFPVTMRVVPSITGSSAATNFRLTQANGAAVAIGGYSTNAMTTESAELSVTGASGLTAGHATTLLRNDTSSIIIYSAEL